MRSAILLGAAVLATACAAPGGRTGNQVASAQSGDDLVCENVIRTGTRVATRTCRRRSDIEESERKAQEMLGEAQRRGTLDTPRLE